MIIHVNFDSCVKQVASKLKIFNLKILEDNMIVTRIVIDWDELGSFDNIIHIITVVWNKVKSFVDIVINGSS